MTDTENTRSMKLEPIIKEIIGLERQYFFEKKNVIRERQKKLREIIERHLQIGS